MSDLRDRIAAAIEECPMPIDGQEWSELLADAVIRELELDKEFGCPVAGHHYCSCSHRYTTPWKDNDD